MSGFGRSLGLLSDTDQSGWIDWRQTKGKRGMAQERGRGVERGERVGRKGGEAGLPVRLSWGGRRWSSEGW